MNLSKYRMNIRQTFHVTYCLVREPKIVASLEEIPMMWLTVINTYKHTSLSGMLECVCFTDIKLAFFHSQRENQLSCHFIEFINEQELAYIAVRFLHFSALWDSLSQRQWKTKISTSFFVARERSALRSRAGRRTKETRGTTVVGSGELEAHKKKGKDQTEERSQTRISQTKGLSCYRFVPTIASVGYTGCLFNSM